MKKRILVLFGVLMVSSSIVACGGKPTGDSGEESSSNASVVVSEENTTSEEDTKDEGDSSNVSDSSAGIKLRLQLLECTTVDEVKALCTEVYSSGWEACVEFDDRHYSIKFSGDSEDELSGNLTYLLVKDAYSVPAEEKDEIVAAMIEKYGTGYELVESDSFEKTDYTWIVDGFKISMMTMDTGALKPPVYSVVITKYIIE